MAEVNKECPELNGEEKPKTKSQLKKDAKRKEKMEKFAAKMEKKSAKTATEQNATEKKKKLKEKKRDVIEYTADTGPGEKKDVSGQMPESYSPRYVEAAWYSWWEKSGFFKPEYGAAKDGEDTREQFTMVIPPPNVTGSLHLGHALNYSIEDTLSRWHRMCGHRVLWNPGCDHAGIATQVVVEKKLMRERGISRHDIGREEFVKEVWKWKEEKGDRIYEQLRRLGSSCDWDRARFTMEEVMCRAVTESFVRLHDEGLIYRAKRLVNWSCSLRSAISDIEVDKKELEGRTMLAVPGYKQKVEFGVLVSFAYPVEGNEDEKLVVSTTRIETMLGDTAVAVHPEDPRYVHLHGKYVRHPLLDRRLPIVCDDFVDRDFGTGAVKITPAHDHTDFEVGMRHKLPFLTVITEEGKTSDNCGPFSGMPRFEARKEVLKALTERGLYVGTQDNPMTLPMCSRSKDVIEPLIKPQWYLDCKSMAKEAMRVVTDGELTIVPEAFHKTWFSWLGEIRDWCISRQLWWGHRIPAYLIWKSSEKRPVDTSEPQAWVSGRTCDDARKAAAQRLGCSENEVVMEQDEDVLDTWYSSQLFPFAIFGWPDETPDLRRFYPGTLLETGHDILFFWVARMVMVGQKLMGQLPFTHVYLHAMIRDAHGRKMSKSLGNVIDPLDVIFGVTLEGLQKLLENSNLDPAEVSRAKAGQAKDYPQGIPECGTDALRFALCAYTTQCRNINLDVLRVQGYRHFCNKLWNAARFALLHALGSDYRPPKSRGNLLSQPAITGTDRWILSRLAATVDIVDRALKSFELATATSALHAFWLYDLCDVYLEYTKPTVREGGERAETVRHILYTCLDAGLRLIHPFMPFVSEELFQRLPRRNAANDPPSLCVTPFPVPSEVEGLRDETLESEMELVKKVIHAVRSLRADYCLTPKQQTSPHFVCSDAATHEILQKFLPHTIIPLSSSLGAEVHLSTPSLPPGCVIGTVSSACVVHLPLTGLIDSSKEVSRLTERRTKLKQQLDKLLKEMARGDYKEKVPVSVREANDVRIKELETEMERTAAALSSLSQMTNGDGWRLQIPHRETPHFLAVRLAATCAGVELEVTEKEGAGHMSGPQGEEWPTLSDPHAMMELLVAWKGGEKAEMKGGDCAKQRADVTQWSTWTTHTVWPEVAKCLQRPKGKADVSRLLQYLRIIEAQLSSGRNFFVTDGLTLADLHLISLLLPVWRFILPDKLKPQLPGLRKWACTMVKRDDISSEVNVEERSIFEE